LHKDSCRYVAVKDATKTTVETEKALGTLDSRDSLRASSLTAFAAVLASSPEIFDFWCANESEALVNAGVRRESLALSVRQGVVWSAG